MSSTTEYIKKLKINYIFVGNQNIFANEQHDTKEQILAIFLHLYFIQLPLTTRVEEYESTPATFVAVQV